LDCLNWKEWSIECIFCLQIPLIYSLCALSCYCKCSRTAKHWLFYFYVCLLCFFIEVSKFFQSD
jgi:hypothetical protein